MKAKHIIVILMLITLGACGGAPSKPKPTIELSANQIQKIRNFDELLLLLKRLNKELNNKDPQTHAEDFATRLMIESQLIDIHKDTLSTLFSSSRHSTGVIPLTILTKQSNYAKNIKDISDKKWESVNTIINNELIKTNTLITQEKAKLENPETSDSEKLSTINVLGEITGNEEWQVKKHQLLDSLVAQIRSARDSGKYNEDIKNKVNLIRAERKDDHELVDEMIGVNASIYEQQFFIHLSNANPDGAYTTFVTMTKSEDFPVIRQKLADTSIKMAALFTSLADESVQNPEQVGQSYRWYSQARFIRFKFDIAQPTLPGETTLIEQLTANEKIARENNNLAMALAYLYMVYDFESNKTAVSNSIRTTEEQLQQLAIKKLSTTAFKNSAMRHDYGSVMSSAITQHLFKQIPNDVRIIEREQYEAIIREKSLSGDKDTALASVDLFVTGSVLESKVDSTESKGKKMMRVVIGTERIPNPAYIAWLELASKERKDIAKPSETINVDQKENISIVITQHRKVGIFSVSFRLVDAHNGKILLPDSITMEEEFTDKSSEGVEMGDFILPFKLANLPSDVKILDRLAKKISGEIGGRLSKHLQNQEKQYINLATKHHSNNNCMDEVDALGKALMILKIKTMKTESVKKQYKEAAVNCRG